MRTAKLIFAFMLLPISYLSAQNPDSVKFKSLAPHDFQELYMKTDSSVLIDVREPFETKKQRLKGALNIPASGNLDRASDTLNKNCTIFLYCTSGYRSSKAAEKLYDKGFRKLVSLKGGMTAWKKDNMPVARGRNKKNK